MRILWCIILCILSISPVFGQNSIYTEILSKRGITNLVIREAFTTVTREPFAPEGSQRYLAADAEVPFPDGGFIIKPSLALSCLLYLAPVPGERCLVAGNGTGYMASLLAHICEDTYVIEESEKQLAAVGDTILSFASGSIAVSDRASLEGTLLSGPFDIIMLSSATNTVPENLLKALSPGGRLLAPLSEPGGFQILMIITKTEGGYSLRALRECFFPGFIRPFP